MKTRMVPQHELARVLGLTARQVRNLENEGILLTQASENGKRYPLFQNVLRYAEHKSHRGRGATTLDIEEAFSTALARLFGPPGDDQISEAVRKLRPTVGEFLRTLCEVSG